MIGIVIRDATLAHQIIIYLVQHGALIAVSCNCLRISGTRRYAIIEARVRWDSVAQQWAAYDAYHGEQDIDYDPHTPLRLAYSRTQLMFPPGFEATDAQLGEMPKEIQMAYAAQKQLEHQAAEYARADREFVHRFAAVFCSCSMYFERGQIPQAGCIVHGQAWIDPETGKMIQMQVNRKQAGVVAGTALHYAAENLDGFIGYLTDGEPGRVNRADVRESISRAHDLLAPDCNEPIEVI